MRSLRSMCEVSRKNTCRNSDVRERCGLKEDVLTRVGRCMLRWSSYLERMKESRLTKQIYTVCVMESADPNYRSAVINTNVIVKHTGEVTWLSHGIYVSVCDINVEQFPFDVQLCTMKWASWTYDGFQDPGPFALAQYGWLAEILILSFAPHSNSHVLLLFLTSFSRVYVEERHCLLQ
ncbi:Acetylcholine receptor subunit alpha-like 1 [Eumeta japonica]|uniref:Acetylcholine receptor subunit alpha-like 1 n=1 Tax=Eumeta variegata TaxID=151549 RepID=A0A4C1Y235_EUMVA|nr:Acetylcholine receptor subunit alpha-like 1 [Eumeta japonica]